MQAKQTVAVLTDLDDKEEFLSLTNEAGYEVVAELTVRKMTSHILSRYKLGKLKELVRQNSTDTVVFDLPLKPRQIYRIAKAAQATPLDRIDVILEIFRRHAPTQEVNLQVKAASLSYELTRAKEKVRLAKTGEHPGFYGLGGYEVDVYYEEIRRRITKIREKLKTIRSRRNQHRRRRSERGIKTVSLTGYTSSGKTTLFNALTGLLQRVGAEPFTTLSTKFAVVQMGPWRLYLVDTIGFIKALPPFLVNAFYSTLEELVFSDVVLLVLDASDPIDTVLERFRSSHNHLIDLEVFDRPIVIVINKTDVADSGVVKGLREYLLDISPYVVCVSALQGTNLRELAEIIAEVAGESVRVKCFVPYTAGDSFYSLVGDLKEKGLVQEMTYSGRGVEIEAVIPSSLEERLRRDLRRIGGRIRLG